MMGRNQAVTATANANPLAKASNGLCQRLGAAARAHRLGVPHVSRQIFECQLAMCYK